MNLFRTLACGVALAFLLSVCAQARETGTTLGAKAPSFVGTDLEGCEVDLAALNAEGKFVMIDFWAKWCRPCIDEFPNLLPFLRSLDNPRFEMISCSLDTEKTIDGLKQVIEEEGISYPVVYDGGGWKARLAVEWGIHAIPATFLVNPDGIIVMRNIRGEEGLETVRRIVEEAPDFVPLPFVVTSAIESDFSVFFTAVEMPRLPPGDYDFTYGYYYAYARQDEDPVRVMQDAVITLSVAETDEDDFRVTFAIEGVDDNESFVNAYYREVARGGRLALTVLLGNEVRYVRTYLYYHEPLLDADLNIAYIYARPPRLEEQVDE